MGLAALYSKLGQYAQAELLFARALQIWEQMGGTEPLQTAQGGHKQMRLLSERQPDEPVASLYEQALAFTVRSKPLLYPGGRKRFTVWHASTRGGSKSRRRTCSIDTHSRFMNSFLELATQRP